MHPGWLDLLALLAAHEGRWRTACLLAGAADRAWQTAARSLGRTSLRVREATTALVEPALGCGVASDCIESGQRIDETVIEAIALSLHDEAASA